MIKAAIFASLLSTFLNQTLSLLQEDPLDAIQGILLYQTLVMQNSTSGPYVPPAFSPPSYAVAVNALFFASLGVVLLAAFLCMLVKGWIRELDNKLRGIPDMHKRAVVRELREQGLRRWRLPGLITIIPSLIHLSLLLFSIGLAVYLLQIHKLPAFLSIASFGVGTVVYILSVSISTIDDFSPFRSPYSRKLGPLYRLLYSHLANSFDSRSCRALPQTIGEKIREWTGTFIKEHEPLSEHAILGPSSSSSRKVTLRNSVPILNKLWKSIDRQDTSSYAKNLSVAILLQLGTPSIRPPQIWDLHWLRETSRFSIKEAECLAYSVCMTSPMSFHIRFVRAMRAALEVLRQSSDPWFHLVASLTSAWVEGAERDLSAWPLIAYERDHVVRLKKQRPSIAERGADILDAISNVRIFSAGQWCFVLNSICTLFVPNDGEASPEDIRASTKILATLLQKGLHHIHGSTICLNAHTDFWLYVTMSVMDKETLTHGPQMSELKLSGEILHARDIGVYGNGMTRDPKNIRRLLQLSQKHNLDQSWVGQCLVSLLYILVSFGPSDEQQIKLVNQYMKIIAEEMDVITWSHYLAALLTNEDAQVFLLSQTVLCLLRGRCLHSLHGYDASKAAPIIMLEYDRKLTDSNVQPTASILRVMDEVIFAPSQMIGLELQNSWLSLYAHNRTHSPHHFDTPVAWSSGCDSIASKRLDLYDRGRVTPEMDLITFFLSCPSTVTACRALRWYLRFQENALDSGGILDLPTIFPNIFRRGLSTDENRMSWLLLVDVLLPRLGSMSLQAKEYFVETFFGYGSSRGTSQAGEDRPTMSSRVGDENVSDPVAMLTPMTALRADGLGWMEDVWTTVLRGFVVHTDHAETISLGLSGVTQATCPESAPPTELTSPSPLSPGAGRDGVPEGTLSRNLAVLGPQPTEEHLGDSARSILKVFAQLLEVGAGLMPAVLLDRLRSSPLLSDEALQSDAGSLHRIRGILNQRI